MSKIKKKFEWLQRANSAKTLLGRAKREIPGFQEHIRKFEQQLIIGGYSESTLFNYSRSIAKISLEFGKSPLELDTDEINAYLYQVAQESSVSSTYFKHMVYGLRFFFRLYDREDKALRLPRLKKGKKLPVVFSHEELKRLFFAPLRLKHRVMFSLIYSAGLRVGELCRLRIGDIDSGRMQIRITQSKGNKDRYVILSDVILIGLRKYFLSSKPKAYLFNGAEKGSPLSHSSVQQSFRLAVKKAGIQKEVCVHTLRHSFATHLLEDGVDIVTIKELLGHSHIQTTMEYLHVAKISRVTAHSPFDSLYRNKG